MFFLYTAQCAAISQFRDSSETESSPNAMWIVEHFTAILSHHASRSSDSFGFITFQFCPLKKIAIRCFSENRMRHLRFLQVWKNANWFCILVRVDRSEPRGPNFSVEHIPVNCCILGLVVGSGCVSVSTRTNFRTKRLTNPHTICCTYDFLYKTNRSQFKNGRNLIFRETIIFSFLFRVWNTSNCMRIRKGNRTAICLRVDARYSYRTEICIRFAANRTQICLENRKRVDVS
jgi:hypothetical protein